MTTIEICLTIGFTCQSLLFVFVLIRVYCLDVELNAMKKSTHKIQWMPVDEAWAQSEKELNKQMEAVQGVPDDFEGI